MTVRVLTTREEWAALGNLDLGLAAPYLLPGRAWILAVEEAGEVIGCWACLLVPHAEGVWIHPKYRGKTSVARRLWRGMRQLVTDLGFTRVQTGSCDDVITQLLERHGGVKLPMDSYILPVKGS